MRLTEGSRPHVDNMGHLSGYAAGIGAASLIRLKDPKWHDVERHRLLTKYFGRSKEQSSLRTLPLD